MTEPQIQAPAPLIVPQGNFTLPNGTVVPDTIEARLFAAQATVGHVAQDVTVVLKDRQYGGVTHHQVTRKAQEALHALGVTWFATVTEFQRSGNTSTVRVQVEFWCPLCIPGHQTRVFEYLGDGVDNGDKGPAKAVSLAIKSALLKILQMHEMDDDSADLDNLPALADTDDVPNEQVARELRVRLAKWAGFEAPTRGDVQRLVDRYNEARRVDVTMLDIVALRQELEYVTQMINDRVPWKAWAAHGGDAGAAKKQGGSGARLRKGAKRDEGVADANEA